MIKSQQVRLRDLRELYLLLGECRELGNDPIAWQTRAIGGLQSLLGAGVCFAGFVSRAIEPQTTHAGLPMPDVELGWRDDAARAYFCLYMREKRSVNDPTFQALLAVPGRLVTRTRDQAYDDAQWYASEAVREFRLPAGVDSWVGSMGRGVGPTGRWLHMLILHRPVGDRPFGAREHRLLRHLHRQLIRLLGRGLALPPDEPPLPRRLQQTLDLLLEGLSEKQIAYRLGLSRHTVHEHIGRLYRRLGVGSRAELMAQQLATRRRH